MTDETDQGVRLIMAESVEPTESVEPISLDDLLEIANVIRNAGGGNPIDALLPAVPADPKQCLIARNLNFNCEVDGFGDNNWSMYLTDEALRDRIAEATGWEAHTDEHRERKVGLNAFGHATYETYTAYAVRLPRNIGQLAVDFDKKADYLKDYIKVAEDEARSLTETNEDGDLIL